MKRLKAQNTKGYENSTNTVETSGDTTSETNVARALKNGAPNSSKANINIARFDTVPLIRNLETKLWYGTPEDGGS